MKRFSVVLVVLVLLVAAVGSAYAITWGQPDGEQHPEVVAVLFQRPDGLYSCTGTLLSPTVVLTAGHCTAEDDGQPNLATWVRNDADIDAAYASERPNYPNLLAWLNDTWISGEAIPHPEYEGFAQFPDTYDIGLVLLDEPIVLDEYAQMPTLGQFDYLKTAKGPIRERRVVIVGYGLQGRIPAFALDLWERYYALSAVVNTGRSANVGDQNFMFTNNPGKGSGSGGTCSGDSGGPAFWVDPATGMETNIVLAVNSYGIAPLCNGNDYQFRTDTAAALDFVLPYLMN